MKIRDQFLELCQLGSEGLLILHDLSKICPFLDILLQSIQPVGHFCNQEVLHIFSIAFRLFNGEVLLRKLVVLKLFHGQRFIGPSGCHCITQNRHVFIVGKALI